MPRIERATYVADYRIRLRFADGNEGEVNLAGELWGEVFEPLKDLAVFRDFHLNPELNTITWSTGADFAPEFLYEMAMAEPVA